jgi:hypothetical protein
LRLIGASLPLAQVGLTWEFVAGAGRYHANVDAISTSPSHMHSYLDRYRINWLVLTYGFAPEGWAAAHLEDRYFIMVRPKPETAALIAREGYQVLRPWESVTVTTNAYRVREEAERARRHCPGDTRFADTYQEAVRLVLERRTQVVIDHPAHVPRD